MIRMTFLSQALLAGLLLSAAPAMAQPSPANAQADEPLDTRAVDDRLDLYWGQQREILPLQRRNHAHEMRHEFTLFSGVVPNERFFSFYPIGLRYDFFFDNDYAVEVWGAYLIQASSELNSFLSTEFNEAVMGDIPPQMQFMTGVSFVWSPLHGKFAAFSSKLTHFDVYLVTGLTILGTREFNDGAESSAVSAGGHLGLGFRVQFLEWMAAKFEYRQHFYPATGGATATPAEFNFGISFWTPGGEQ